MLFMIEHIVKKFRNGEDDLIVLNDVNIELEENKIYTILGPSGSGKTTFLNVLSGLENVNSGNIFFETVEYNIANKKEKELTLYRRNNVGFVFQNYNLVPTLTVMENIKLTEEISNDSLDINEVISVLGLDIHKNKYPHQLSGGQQQRVAIARVLIKKPKVIFCDEPTGALDEENGRNILDILQGLNKDYGTSIIIVTHNPNIARLSDTILYFKNGKIINKIENEKKETAYDIEWS